jgi:hypothetical protein
MQSTKYKAVAETKVTVLLCSPGRSGIREPPASTFQGLELQGTATMPGSRFLYLEGIGQKQVLREHSQITS